MVSAGFGSGGGVARCGLGVGLVKEAIRDSHVQNRSVVQYGTIWRENIFMIVGFVR